MVYLVSSETKYEEGIFFWAWSKGESVSIYLQLHAWPRVLSDFINLTQVHNFTVSAQGILTFRRLSAFTVSCTGILQVLMEILERFVLSYWLVKWLWYRVYTRQVVSSSPSVFFFFAFIWFFVCLFVLLLYVPSQQLWSLRDGQLT